MITGLISLGAGMVFGTAVGNLVLTLMEKKYQNYGMAWLGLSIALFGFAF